ncbi:MAG: hypothetical protein WBB37_06410 [bacterium]
MKKLLFLLPIIAFVIGCGGEAIYFPITVGNTWLYQTTMTTIVQVDSVTADTTILTGETDAEISAETTLDAGTPVFEIISTTTWDDTLIADVTDTSFIEETEDYLLSYEDKADTEPDTTLVLPIENGNTWTVSSDSVLTTTAVVMGQQDVQVPAGTYTECWRIASISTPGDDTVYTYYAPDVGYVLGEQTSVDSLTSFEAITELLSATIN